MAALPAQSLFLKGMSMSPKIELMGVMLTVVGAMGTGAWKAGKLSKAIERNSADVQTIEEKLDDQTNRLARIEGKLDILVGSEK